MPALGWPGMLAQPLRAALQGLSLGFLMGDRAEDRFRYADTNLLIG